LLHFVVLALWSAHRNARKINLAARVESAGSAGRVNISEETYCLVNADFNCTPRGKVMTKNKGELDMFFVEKAI
jgi:class 3 adenylate cyclase